MLNPAYRVILMNLIVISNEDPASVNIRERLFELSKWTKHDELRFDGNEVYTYLKKALLVSINSYHLFFDNIGTRVQDELDMQEMNLKINTVIFASKHKSASGLRTLTVHPVGNFNKAEYGGKPNELVPAAPYMMTMAYRILHQQAIEGKLDHSVTFEATHHGPYLNTPSFFIEIGSDETAWCETNAARSLAQTIIKLLELEVKGSYKDFPVAIGIGGGHYAPRHSDVARKKRISFGHIIPSYAIPDITEYMLERVVARTPDSKYVYFHRKALKKDKYRELKTWFTDYGLIVVSSDDLEDLK